MSRTWNHWGRGKSGKGGGKRSKQGGGDKDGKDQSQLLPGYDSLPSSSQQSVPDSKKEDPLKAAMRELVLKNNLEVPEDIKEYFEPKLTDILNQDQKSLNAKRKLLQKLDRLKTAKEKKHLNWEAFKESMKEHLVRERTRYETEQQELDQAIQETQTALDKMTSGKDEEMEPEAMQEEDIHTMLGVGSAQATTQANNMDKEKDALIKEQAELLQKTQAGQAYLAQQLENTQNQLAYFASMQAPSIAHTPPRQSGTTFTAMSPQQEVKHPFPRHGSTGAESYGKFTEKNPILIPDSPYGKRQKTEEEAAATEEPMEQFLNTMDGQGLNRQQGQPTA